MMTEHVQSANGWRDFCKRMGELHKLSPKKISQVIQQISYEVQWLRSFSPDAKMIQERIDKYDQLLKSKAMPLENYDPYWKFRVEFFRWVMNNPFIGGAKDGM
jgi:hypothetical protein